MAKKNILILMWCVAFSPGRVWRQRSRGSASDAVQCYFLYDTIIGMKSHYYLIPHLNKTNTKLQNGLLMICLHNVITNY